MEESHILMCPRQYGMGDIYKDNGNDFLCAMNRRIQYTLLLYMLCDIMYKILNILSSICSLTVAQV